jgi:hypothetical protein
MKAPNVPQTVKPKYNTIMLSREWAVDLILDPGCEVEGFIFVDKDYDGDSRWENHYTSVVQRVSDGTYWSHSFSMGKSETQDHRSWDYKDELEFTQVERLEETVTKIEVTYKSIEI